VAPAVAVISVGTPNRYRHPSAEILAHYSDEGTTVLRTDEEGAIVFETDGKAFERVIWNDE
jgi:competence protein ComEC